MKYNVQTVFPGFDYAFNAIQKEDNEVYLAYKDMFELSLGKDAHSIRFLLGIWYPWIDKIWVSASARSLILSTLTLPSSQHTNATRVIVKSHKVIYGLSNRLVQDKKRQFLGGKYDESNSKSLLSLLSMPSIVLFVLAPLRANS